jgi:SAM-dependent methyltransferase
VSAPSTIRHDTALRHQHKYANKNPLQRFALGRFFDAVAEEVRALQPELTLDFGCGEGLFLQRLKERGVSLGRFCGIDLRPEALELARRRHPDDEFVCADLLTWSNSENRFDLVIASEVLEHLPGPERFLRRLIHFSSQHLLLTVPLEPWFRIMNLLRGRDLGRLGNHPEHVNLWGLRSFRKFVSPHVEIARAYTVFPFIIVVARPSERPVALPGASPAAAEGSRSSRSRLLAGT